MYLVKGYLHFKVDTSYDTTEDANYMMNQDPCLRGSHLFEGGQKSDDSGDNSVLEHYSIQINSGAAWQNTQNTASSIEFFADSLWIVASEDNKKLWRVTVPNNGGLDWGNIKRVRYFRTNDLADNTIDYYDYVGNS